MGAHDDHVEGPIGRIGGNHRRARAKHKIARDRDARATIGQHPTAQLDAGVLRLARPCVQRFRRAPFRSA
jgi:hypothetical protein